MAAQQEDLRSAQGDFGREGAQFSSLETFREAAQSKKAFSGEHPWYPRDEDPRLRAFEKEIATRIGACPQNVLAYNFGMAAIADAVASVSPARGDTILHAAGYSQSNQMFETELRKVGVRPVIVDLSSPSAIKAAVEKHHPKFLFTETITNDPSMSVPRINAIFEATQGSDSLVIIDNTLPFSTGYDLDPLLREHPDRKIIAVYSGMKYLGGNKTGNGIAVTYHEPLLQRLLQRRRMVGSRIPNASITEMQDELNRLPTKEAVDERIRTIFRNTRELAQACYDIQNPDLLYVRHPNVGNHKDKDYADITFPQGATPVFFLEISNPDRLTHHELADAFEKNPTIMQYCRFGTSFGFNRPAILEDDSYASIRIAGGTQTPEENAELAQGFQEALQSVKGRSEAVIFIFGGNGETVENPKGWRAQS